MNREYPDYPIFAVGGIIFKGNQVLLIKRAEHPDKGKWTIPGGVVEVGERIQDALKREIFEETSLIVSVGRLVSLFEKIIKDPYGRIRFHYVIADYRCQVAGGKLNPGSDASDARFFNLEEVSKLNLTQGLMETIQKAI